jgi:hypothetical protein
MTSSRAETICSQYEGISRPEATGAALRAVQSEREFVDAFKSLYARLPGNYRDKPVDMGTEVVKTQLIITAIEDLISALKAR